jgi:hypothetical protein
MWLDDMLSLERNSRDYKLIKVYMCIELEGK